MFDRISLDPVPKVRAIDFGALSARAHLLNGWSSDEQASGRTVAWSDGPSSEVAFRRPSSGAGCVLKVTLQAMSQALPLIVKASVNGTEVGGFAPTKDWGKHELTVPAVALNDATNVLKLEYGKTARPKDSTPGSNDTRELAVRVDEIQLAAP
jgi:hypothetical protein